LSQKRPPLAKITCPELPAVVPRPRLFRLLDRARARIVWIVGPPGAGKTTLAASYLSARKLPALWYQVDAGDADPATFFHYLGIAAARAAPQYKKALPVLTPEYRPGLDVFTKRYFELLCARLPDDCTLVLDNYQQVAPSETAFHEVVREALLTIPAGRRVLVISRSEPPSALARLQAGQELEMLDGEALRATPRETRDIARLKQTLSTGTVRALHETTGGWVAGIILLAQRTDASKVSSQKRPVTVTKEVFNYFAGEVFERAAPDVQEFLLQTAFLPKMTIRMVERLTGLQRSRRILEDLNRDNYFTEKRGDAPPAYHYHDLFRNFLLERAREVWTPATLSQIRHRAAASLEEAGQIEDAVDLFQQAGDWAGVARLALRQAPLLIAQGRHATLEGWFNAMPEEAVSENPWLLHWLGVCRLPFNPPLSRSHLERAFEQFSARGDDAGSLWAWSGVVNSILYEWGKSFLLDRWIAWLEARMERDPAFPSAELETRVVSDMAHALLYRQPQHPDIVAWLKRALSLAQKAPDPNLRFQVTATVVTYCIWTGHFDWAGELVKGMKRYGRSPEVSPLFAIQWKWGEAFYYIMRNSPAESLQAVAEGLAICRNSGIGMGKSVLLTDGMYAALCRDDLKMAGEFLAELEASVDRSRGLEMCQYHMAAMAYALRCDEISMAVDHAEKGIASMAQREIPLGEAMMRFNVAQVLHEYGAHQRSERELRISHRLSRRAKSLIIEHICLLTWAQFGFDAGTKESEARGLKALRGAMRLGRQQDFINFPEWRPQVMAKLCAKALEHGIETDYARYLIRTRHLVPDASLPGCEHWPWPLKLYTLGRFSVVKEGTPVRFAARGQGKVLECLKALISLGGREIEAARLAEALWPEADGDKAHQAFKTTLHRLRKRLGCDEVVSVQDGRVSLDGRYCWVDVWAFERLLGKTRSASSSRPESSHPRFDPDSLNEAVALYRGHFLGEDPGLPWAMALRERLHTGFLRGVSELGVHLEAAGDWKPAADCYQRALGVDPLVEEFYQRLMLCHQRLGQRAEAVSVYQRCRKILDAGLGIAPSAETDAICRDIKAGRPPLN
jgi:LuxR family maltose regulon positive regulatory protein